MVQVKQAEQAELDRQVELVVLEQLVEQAEQAELDKQVVLVELVLVELVV